MLLGFSQNIIILLLLLLVLQFQTALDLIKVMLRLQSGDRTLSVTAMRLVLAAFLLYGNVRVTAVTRKIDIIDDRVTSLRKSVCHCVGAAKYYSIID